MPYPGAQTVAGGQTGPALRFLRFPQLKAEKGIPFSRMHVDRLEKAGEFPRRVRLGPGTVAWVEAEIDAHLAAKMADRDPVAA